tara:strand:- start:2125 stop:2406 length:282 start_codon:yes stop_codon:yes gene_type:complete
MHAPLQFSVVSFIHHNFEDCSPSQHRYTTSKVVRRFATYSEAEKFAASGPQEDFYYYVVEEPRWSREARNKEARKALAADLSVRIPETEEVPF